MKTTRSSPFLQAVLDTAVDAASGIRKIKRPIRSEAFSKDINDQFLGGVGETQGLKLVSDNGFQPILMKFIAACRSIGIDPILTNYDNP